MSGSSNHAIVLTSQETPEDLRDMQLAKARYARSIAKSTRLLRESASAIRASTKNRYQRDQQAARIQHLDEHIAYWNSIAEEAEKEAAQAAAQGGEQ